MWSDRFWRASRALALGGAWLSTAATAGAVVIYDNGPLVTAPGGGFGQCAGDDVSLVQTTSLGMANDGFVADDSGSFRLASDFYVNRTTDLTKMVFYAFQGMSGSTTCTIDTANVQIWSDDPREVGATVLFGDTTTNRFLSCTYAGIVRVVEHQSDCSRRVMAIEASVPTELASGTYWVDFRFGVSSGNPAQVPPTTQLGFTSTCGVGCTGLRWNGSAWSELLDQGTNARQDVPFVIEGLPERTIVDGEAYFSRSPNAYSTAPTGDFGGVGGNPATDHLYETGWAFRVAGDSQETFFPTPNGASFGGNSSSVNWTNVAGRGLFSAHESGQIFETDTGAYVVLVMTLTNLSASQPLDINLFHMADFDLGGAGGGDAARLGAWTPLRNIRIEDGGHFAEHAAAGSATKYLVRTYGAGDLQTTLVDGDVDNFDNSGLPFNSADYTGGFQVPLLIGPSQSVPTAVILALNTSIQCDFPNGILCDGFETANFVIWSQKVP